MGTQLAQYQLTGTFGISDRFSGISLWLMPPQKERDALRKVIDSVAEEQHSATFEPHITLASLSPGTSTEGWVDVITAHLRHHAPVLAGFNQVRTGETFFQSVLTDIQRDKRLLAFRGSLIASITQGRAPDPKLEPEWHPHLSLFYGSPPQTDREVIVKNLEDTGVVQQDGETCTVGKIQQFEANEVWIVQTEGYVKEWRLLDSVVTPMAR
jgi:hypothetical protein